MPEEAARVLGIVLVVRIYHKDLGSSVRQATTATRVTYSIPWKRVLALSSTHYYTKGRARSSSLIWFSRPEEFAYCLLHLTGEVCTGLKARYKRFHSEFLIFSFVIIIYIHGLIQGSSPTGRAIQSSGELRKSFVVIWRDRVHSSTSV